MKEGGEMVEQGQERKARGSHSRTDRTGLGDLARSHGRLRAAHTQPPEGAALRGVSQDEPGERHHRVTAELRHPEATTETPRGEDREAHTLRKKQEQRETISQSQCWI